MCVESVWRGIQMWCANCTSKLLLVCTRADIKSEYVKNFAHNDCYLFSFCRFGSALPNLDIKRQRMRLVHSYHIFSWRVSVSLKFLRVCTSLMNCWPLMNYSCQPPLNAPVCRALSATHCQRKRDANSASESLILLAALRRTRFGGRTWSGYLICNHPVSSALDFALR